MISNLWTRKGMVLVAAIVTLTCVAALLSVNLASPDPISSAALGADWQCSRIAFVFTACTPPVHNRGATTVVRARNDSGSPQPKS